MTGKLTFMCKFCVQFPFNVAQNTPENVRFCVLFLFQSLIQICSVPRVLKKSDMKGCVNLAYFDIKAVFVLKTQFLGLLPLEEAQTFVLNGITANSCWVILLRQMKTMKLLAETPSPLITYPKFALLWGRWVTLFNLTRSFNHSFVLLLTTHTAKALFIVCVEFNWHLLSFCIAWVGPLDATLR